MKAKKRQRDLERIASASSAAAPGSMAIVVAEPNSARWWFGGMALERAMFQITSNGFGRVGFGLIGFKRLFLGGVD